jgi:hypothetical protein
VSIVTLRKATHPSAKGPQWLCDPCAALAVDSGTPLYVYMEANDLCTACVRVVAHSCLYVALRGDPPTQALVKAISPYWGGKLKRQTPAPIGPGCCGRMYPNDPHYPYCNWFAPAPVAAVEPDMCCGGTCQRALCFIHGPQPTRQ